MNEITSVSNPLIKKIVHLHTAQGRKEQGLFIVEGSNVLQTIAQRMQLIKLFVTPDMLHESNKYRDHQKITLVSSAVMKKISSATTPSGLLGLVKIPQQPAADALGPGIVLQDISDPGNMGTLIRTTAACGLKSVVVIGGVDPWSPKVIQASAGTIAFVDIFDVTWQNLIKHKRDLQLYGLVVKSEISITKITNRHNLLVVGNEARGINPDFQTHCDQLVTLPMPGATESLNAAVAGSIALYAVHVL